jgi:4-oxalocrotonate tautomerase
MPFITIRILKDNFAEDGAAKKSRITQSVVKAITDNTRLTENDVWVVFEEVAGRDWFVGTTDVETMRKKQ